MADKKLTVYFTSDLHGYIYPTDYRSRDERDIGLFKCASRFEKDGNTLVTFNVSVVLAERLDQRARVFLVKGLACRIVVRQHLGHMRAKALIEHEHVSHADNHLLDIFHNVSFVMLADTTQALPQASRRIRACSAHRA